MLFRNAQKNGVDARDESKVVRVVRENGDGAVVGVVAQHLEGTEKEYHAPITIDCSGREAFWLSKQQWRRRDPVLNKVAIWTYYKGAMRDPGLDAGSTTVAYIPNKGWFWYIPLRDNRVSVGIVAERDYLFRATKDPASIMAEEIPRNAWIAGHLKDAKCEGEFWVTGEYSYRAKHCAKDGLVLAGDAFAFLDPVFSSGVFLALKSGQLAADAVHVALEQDDVSAGQFLEYGETLCGGIETMRKLVYAFYNPDFSFKDLVMQYPESRGALTDRLIGDLFSDSEALFEALANFSALPTPLPHGRPPVAAVACVSSN
jgi:flavin-dependent dehydrogenase